MKKLKTGLVALFAMFFMAAPVFAAGHTLEETKINPTEVTGFTANPTNDLAYIVGTGYDNTYKENGNGNDVEHGSINIFGKVGTGSWYETSYINVPNIAAAGKLSGIFPVFAVGSTASDDYKYLTASGNILTGEHDGIKVTVSASFVLAGQYIKVNYNVNNSNGEDKTVNLGGYNDVQIAGNDDGLITPFTRASKNVGFYYSHEQSKIYFILRDYEGQVTDVNQYWIGDRETDPSYKDEYKALFEKSETYNTTANSDDASMAFSWIGESIPANSSKDYSILIGIGNPAVTVTGEKEYNRDNSKDVIVNGTLSDPTIIDGETNQLWYRLNEGTATKIGEPRSDKEFNYDLNLKDDKNLIGCGENVIKVWAGTADRVDSNIAEHTFTVTAASCNVKNPQTGVNINYIVLGLILAGGIGTYIYTRKHNKFPQV